MNLLAHLYLSTGINDVMFGNYIADFVKGNKYLNYTPDIQDGILLHRKIDTYTDNHQVTKLSRDKFRNAYGLFSGVVVDILYDHYLANHWSTYSHESLNDFSQKAYAYIESRAQFLPDRLKQVTPYMIQNNWILMYKSLDGIQRVLNGMANRTSLPDKSEHAMQVIEHNYSELEKEFIVFFNELISFLDI